MNAFKAIEACVTDALGDHANSGVRASQARVERAVDRALQHTRTRVWRVCRELMRYLSADEVIDIIDKMVHVLAFHRSLPFMASEIGDVIGVELKCESSHHTDGDDQYTVSRLSIPWALDSVNGRAAVVAMFFMLTTPYDLDVLDFDEDGKPVDYVPDSLKVDGSLEICSQQYGADIFGEDHPEYVVPGTVEQPIFVPALLAELVPFRW